MICSLRIPDVLQARIDEVAGSEGRSKWILEACRMRLDAADNHEAERQPDTIGFMQTLREATSPAKPDMQALRDICAGVVVPHEAVVRAQGDFIADLQEVAEIPICGKTWWEDGNHYECLMDKGHKEQKHGLRGMVRVLEG